MPSQEAQQSTPCSLLNTFIRNMNIRGNIACFLSLVCDGTKCRTKHPLLTGTAWALQDFHGPAQQLGGQCLAHVAGQRGIVRNELVPARCRSPGCNTGFRDQLRSGGVVAQLPEDTEAEELKVKDR